MDKSSKKREVYRDAITGQFIKKSEAEKKPSTTVKQTYTIKRPKRKKT